VPASPLTHGDAQDLLQAYKRAWERRDPDAAMELYAEDAEHRDDPFHDPHLGSNAIRAMWNDIAEREANVEFDAERIWLVDRTVLSSWHAAYTDRANGDRVRLRGFMTMELDGRGKIARLREWPVSKVVGTDSTYKEVPSGG
jgi:ketosteroid isomerase-like protein